MKISAGTIVAAIIGVPCLIMFGVWLGSLRSDVDWLRQMCAPTAAAAAHVAAPAPASPSPAAPQPISPTNASPSLPWLVVPTIVSVSASSVFVRGTEQHPAIFAVDGARRTAWCSAPGQTTDEWIELRFDRPLEIRRIRLVPGYDKRINEGAKDLFDLNGRIRLVRISFDGKEKLERAIPVELRTLEIANIAETASSIRFVAADVRNGDGDAEGEQTVCVSEISLAVAGG